MPSMDDRFPEIRREEALARFLALRAPDLDGWEEDEARRLPEARVSLEVERDDVIEGILDAWAGGTPAPRAVPSVEAILRAVEARDQDPIGEEDVPDAVTMASPPPPVGWLPTLALAAALAIACFGLWKVRPVMTDLEPALPGTEDAGQRLKGSATQAADATRVELQWSVERAVGDRVVVVPGQRGDVYRVNDGLAIRADVRGEGGFFYLVELRPGEEPRPLWPEQGQALKLAAGAHALVGSSGDPLIYRPEPGQIGAARYLALLTSEELEPAPAVAALLVAGLDKPALWPRPVRSADAFEITWEAASP